MEELGAGVCVAEEPPHSEGPDDITLDKGSSTWKAEHPETAAPIDSVDERVKFEDPWEQSRVSPVPTVMSMKSEQSMDEPVTINKDNSVHHSITSPTNSSCSMNSEKSLDEHVRISRGNMGYRPTFHYSRSSPVPSEMSMKSMQSMDEPVTITEGNKDSRQTEEPAVLCDVCPKRAFKSCLTCLASFCEVHVKPHYTAPALQRHRLVEATEELEERLCQRHNRELFCGAKEKQIQNLGMKMAKAFPAPENVTVDTVTPTSATLSWSLDQGMQQIPHTFLISYCSEGTETQTISTEWCRTTLTGLQPDTQYRIGVCCKLKDEDRKSEVTTVMSQTAVPPPGPIEFTSVKPDSVCLCWGPPEGLPGPHTFRVSWKGAGSQEQLEVQGQEINVEELTPGVEYSFTVATLRDEGRESPSVAAAVVTDVPPPEDLAVDVHLTSASVSWNKPTGVDQASYLLYLYTGKTSLKTTVIKSLQYHFSDLNIEGEYSVRVSTLMKERNSKPASKTFRMDGFVPKKLSVDDLAVEPVDQWSATLSWSLQQGMQQIPHTSLISYYSEGTEPQTIPIESCSTTLTGLQPDTKYTATVCTVLQNGEKTKTASITFHTSERRIVLLGKSGEGKSSTGNTILGEDVFLVKSSQYAVTNKCEARSKIVNGRKITVIDTPGFLDPTTPDKLGNDIRECMSYSSPGPHAFIIVLRVGKYKKEDKYVIDKIQELFTSEIFERAVVVFTHGEELKGQTLEQFVAEKSSSGKSEATLKEVVEKCQGRCHVIDNEYWKQEQAGKNNKTKIVKVLATIEEIVQQNGGHYTEKHLVTGGRVLQGLENMLSVVLSLRWFYQ